MRTFSANINTILATDNIETFYLVKIIIPDDEPIRETTASFNIDIPGDGTYSSTSNLLIIDQPKLSDVVDREAYKLTFMDPTFEKLGLFENGLTGAEVTVKVGFFNTISEGFGGAAFGQPIPNDYVIAYKGVVDTQGYTIDPDNGTAIAVIECSSPVAALGRARSFYSSKENMQRINPADTAFDEIYIGMQESAILWGKEKLG